MNEIYNAIASALRIWAPMRFYGYFQQLHGSINVKYSGLNNCFSEHCAFGLAAFMMLLAFATSATANAWEPLAKDGVHDPQGPGIVLLQEPSEGLRGLPPSKSGNIVDWMQALSQGVISPRRIQNPSASNIPPMFKEIIMLNKNGSMPMIPFPHKAHTMWLECSHCHPAIFEEKIGATNFSMEKILYGEQCGLCHGSVAFPLVDCTRCHSIKSSNPVTLPSGKVQNQ